jgi:pyridoxal phosphate-dependent aminotransferase EpsN
VDKKRIFLSPPSTNGQELQAVVNAINSNWIAPFGPYIDKFENRICELVSAKHAVAVSSGTAAIHLALMALGVSQGDTVFCSDLTFAGSCFPILYQCATPVFIDCKADGWGMSEVALEKAFHAAKISGRLPKAVIIVDLYGQSADYEMLLPICERYDVPVIEDAAEALGTKYNGIACGAFGTLNIFSFNGNKIITTSGGGMLLSDNTSLLNKAKFWSTQSREPEIYYQHKEVGYNYRMSNICAALGFGQLGNLQERIEKKKIIFNRYKKEFDDLPITMMPLLNKGEANYWLSVMTINDDSNVTASDIIMALQVVGIESRYAWKPMHLQPIFMKNAFYTENKGNSVGEFVFSRGVCLPSGTDLTVEEQHEIVNIIRDVFATSAIYSSNSLLIDA